MSSSENQYGISPTLSQGKIAFIDVVIPTCPGFSLRIARDAVVELHHYLGLLLQAEAEGTIEQLCPPRK